MLEPIIRDFQLCEQGFSTSIPIDGVPTDIFVEARLLLNTSDLPATRKLTGTMGISHNRHPCQYCAIKKDELLSPKAYDWRNLPPNHPAHVRLRANFAYVDASPRKRYQIEETHGIRYSSICKLIGFEHAASSPVDPLHNSFLGLVRSFVTMLLNGALFEGELGGESRLDVFCQVFENALYPGHLGRLPNRITKQIIGLRRQNTHRGLVGSGLKADQWKRVAQLLPLALYAAFRDDVTDTIPDIDISLGDEEEEDEQIHRRSRSTSRSRARTRSRSTSRGRKQRSASVQSATSSAGRERSQSVSARIEIPTSQEPKRFVANRMAWYNVALSLCSGLRILHAHAITLRDAESAVDVSDEQP